MSNVGKVYETSLSLSFLILKTVTMKVAGHRDFMGITEVTTPLMFIAALHSYGLRLPLRAEMFLGRCG
jgi:hypothetical protein